MGSTDGVPEWRHLWPRRQPRLPAVGGSDLQDGLGCQRPLAVLWVELVVVESFQEVGSEATDRNLPQCRENVEVDLAADPSQGAVRRPPRCLSRWGDQLGSGLDQPGGHRFASVSVTSNATRISRLTDGPLRHYRCTAFAVHGEFDRHPEDVAVERHGGLEVMGPRDQADLVDLPAPPALPTGLDPPPLTPPRVPSPVRTQSASAP